MLPTLTGATRILGVIADPVAQARTPGMANSLLEQRGLFGRYVLVPMHVTAEAFPDFLKGLRGLRNFSGAVVSMPHKTVAAALVDDLSPEARMVGALNVIRRDDQGRLSGTLLDGEGFVAGLEKHGHHVAGATVLLVGAGGAASAIAFALAKHGCARMCILNRTADKARALADRLGRTFPAVELTTADHADREYDLAINGTSLGMREGDELPLSESAIDRSRLIAECVVAPEMTPLLHRAVRMSKRIQSGVPMLAAQMSLMLAYMDPGTAPAPASAGDLRVLRPDASPEAVG